MTPTAPIILIVEDDPLLAGIIAQKLSSESFRVNRVGTAEEAMQVLEEEHQPDLMLLDIRLPGMNGFELLEKIRALPEMAKLPVIVLSNFSEPSDVERSKQLGVLQHILKVSLTPAEIVDVVRKAIGEHKGK